MSDITPGNIPAGFESSVLSAEDPHGVTEGWQILTQVPFGNV